MFDKVVLEKIMKWSKDTPHPKGLSVETTKKVTDYFKKNFGCYLPQGYVEFLNVMNGFSNDGYSIFCCYNDDIENNFPRYKSLDLVTFNTKFYENTDITDYIMLGKSSIDYVGYIKATGKYVIMTNGIIRHLKEFDTFEEMLIDFFYLN